MNLEAFGGRRFIATIGAGVATTGLQWFGKLDPAGTTYALVVIATVAAYITGNTAQKVRTNPTPAQPAAKDAVFTEPRNAHAN
jgi:hypothetical protein|tara:strand:- start:779 stop:1027 length:249 start_codon:yes stop_codon:yes gene_type:complete